MRQNLVYQDRENPDGVIFNPDLLDDEQNWAYLRATQAQLEYGEGDDEQEQLEALLYGQTSGKGLKSLLAQKERKMRANASAASQSAGDAATSEAGTESENFDRLRGILDSDDPRFERLHRENIQHLERGVAALSDNMGLAIDQFYTKATETYRDIRHQTNFAREAIIPQANVAETCPEQITMAKARWQFRDLPGAHARVPKLIQEPKVLGKLQQKLESMQAMALWSEPVDFMPQPSESFFATIQELLGTIAAKELDKLHPSDRSELVSLQANAIKSVFGVAVLSGSYEMIVQALNTIYDFTEKATEDNVNAVFALCKPVLESYLEQITAVTNTQRAYHTMHGDNISAIFGSQMKIYPNYQFSRNNTSITTDGAYLYLLIGQEKRAAMYKIGTGMAGTLAGRVYLTTGSKKEGNMTWAFCRGKLYMRRSMNLQQPFGAISVVDPNDFRILSDLNLDLEEHFKEHKELMRRNRDYPLLSDGDFLYTVVVTVEKRERAIKVEHAAKAAALRDLKQSEREKQQKEAADAKAKKAKEKAEKAEKKDGKPQKDQLSMFRGFTVAEVDEVDFFHGQQYFVAAFKVLRFDLSRTKETKPKTEEPKEIDFLSMSEPQLFDMPIVQEMYATFSGFYNLKRCALALQHNNDDIHNAGQWLIEEKDVPYLRAHAQAQKQAETPKKEPPTIEVAQEFLLAEAVVRSKWDENSTDNAELSIASGILRLDCLECGKWTVNGEQITYHTDHRSTVANYVFSLKEDEITSNCITSKESTSLEKSSFENSRASAAAPERAPLPSYISHKSRGPGEEEFSSEMKERISAKFRENDPENTGSIGMESFGMMINELELIQEDDGDVMEEAFDGLDMDERDTMKYEEFMTIARRLGFKKKQDEDKKKMADITEEQLESVFNRSKAFNQASEEECLSMSACYDALRRLKIKMNPREYERKFHENDANRDRFINLEEFRRFLGKEPKNEEERKKEPTTKKKKVHVSNLVFFWDGVEWLSYTPQEVTDGTHMAMKESKRSEIAKNQGNEAAKEYDWTSEWSLYEAVKVNSSNIYIEADRGTQLDGGPCYVTYDKTMGKFVCMTLTHAYNFFMVDDLTSTSPQTFSEVPSTKVLSFSSLNDNVLQLLSWVGEKRFSMPWRWSLWSQTFTNVLQFLENGRTFLKDEVASANEEKNDEKVDESTKKEAIKKIKKRLRDFKEREVTRELQRVGQPIANNEQAINYRAAKDRKDRMKNQKGASKDEDSGCESIIELDSHVLPLEKIYLAQENKKVHAYCTTGNIRVIRALFLFLKVNERSEVSYRALLDAFVQADQLLAYHDQAFMNQIREFLVIQVTNRDTTEAIKQHIWRILVVGWYKFASNAEHQISLLTLFVAQSKPLERQELYPVTRWLDKLLVPSHLMTPIELFNHRFYSTPAAFFFLEMIQISKVNRYHICLRTEDLLDPKLTTSEKKAEEEPTPSVGSTDLNVTQSKLETSVLSIALPLDGPEKPPISFRNKSKISLGSNYSQILECPQVSQSLTKVPIEYVEFKNLKQSEDPALPISEGYFAMPLYQILNEEMINFDSPDLPKDDLDFLCQRYSDETCLDQTDLDAKERKQVQFQHLIQLRESNQDGRDSLIESMMRAINQSQGIENGVDHPWDDQASPAMINVLRRLLQAAYAILKVHNPRHIKCTIAMLGHIDGAFSKMKKATENFSNSKLTETNIKWLEHMKQLLMTVVQNLQCNLGYVMQTELAVNALPLLMSIFKNIKELFSRQYTVTDEETGETSNRVADLFDSLSTLNIEGPDPASYRVFESPHPVPSGSYQIKENYQVPRAIGFMVEFDPQTAKCLDGNIHLRTSRTTYEYHPRDVSSIKNLVLVGSSLHVRFSSGERGPSDWGIKLTVKPIIGKPQQLSKEAPPVMRELEAMLTTTRTHAQTPGSAPSAVTSWLTVLNQVVFLMSFLTRGLQDPEIISQQTNGRLKNGAGIFKNFGKSADQLRQEVEFDSALNYAIPKWSVDPKTSTGQHDEPLKASEAEIEKKQLLAWHLFKSGLILPQMDNKSAQACVFEGLRLMSDSLMRRQNERLDSLELVNEADDQKKCRSDSIQLLKKRTSSFLRRQSTLMKLDEAQQQFKGRKEVWSSQLSAILGDNTDFEGSLLTKVLDKMRSGIGPEAFGYKSMWSVRSAQPYRPLWLKVQKLFVASVLYHSDLLEDCETFVNLPDDKVSDIYCGLQEQLPEVLYGDQRTVYQFMLIRQKVDSLLTWMKSRLDGQKYFNFTITDTVEIAKEKIAKAVDTHRQTEELKLMSEAEAETIAYNRQLKEYEAKEAARKKEEEEKQAEERKKEELQQSKKRKQSAGKVRSSAPAGMRRNQRKNISRLSQAVPKAQTSKKAAASRESAPQMIGDQSPLDMSKPQTSTTEEQANLEEENDQIQDLVGAEQAKKAEEIKLCDLTDSELTILKKEIYDEAFQKFESGYGNHISQLCSFFDIENDQKDKSKTLRAVFRNIKSRMVSYIDFDNAEMPIPAQFSDKMIKIKNPHEEIANDVANRLTFLFEVKPSKDYREQVTKQLNVVEQNFQGAGLDDITFEESKALVSQADKNSGMNDQVKLKQWSKVQSESPQDFMRYDSSALQAIFIFAKCSRISNVVHLRNMMLDQLYTASFRLLSMQILQQLYTQITPTLFSRFVQGSVSYALDSSILHQIETCGERTTRQLNAIACQLVEQTVAQINSLQEQLSQNEKEHREQEIASAEEKSQLSSQQLSPQALQDAPEQPRGLKKLPPSGIWNHVGPGNSLFSSSFGSNWTEKRSLEPSSRKDPMAAREYALAKQQSKKAQRHTERLIEDQRKVVQGLNDIRVLLSNQYSKEYFLGSLKLAGAVEQTSGLTIEAISDFLKGIIGHIVGGQLQQAEVFTEPQTEQAQSSTCKGTTQNVQTMRTQLASASRAILDSLLISNQARSGAQQLLTDITLEIVVEQLERVCYVKRTGSDGEEQIMVDIDDLKHKEEYIQLLKLFSELTRGSDAKQNEHVDLGQVKKVGRVAQLLANMVLHVQVPEVMRITVKCARSHLRKVNLRDIKLLKTVDQSDEKDPLDFLSEAIRTIGAKISDSESVAKNIEGSEEDEPAGLDELLAEYPSEPTPPSSEKEYYVYTNLNCPLEEDFTFIVTTLWHWYQANPPTDLKVIKDPAEITVEAPPEEKKPEEAKKPEGEEEKKAPEVSSEDQPKPDEALKPAAEEPSKEEKKDAEGQEQPKEAPAEEEKKGEPDAVVPAEDSKEAEVPVVAPANEEEKKGEPKAVAAPEEEKKGEPDAVVEEEKKGEPDAPVEEKKEPSEEEKQRQIEEEAKEKERTSREQAERKEREFTEKSVIDRVLGCLKEICPDFVASDTWMEIIKTFKPKETEVEQVEKIQEQVAKSCLAPALKDILGGSRQGSSINSLEYLSESETKPLKIIELKQILEIIIKETYQNPTTNDSEEVKQRKMQEKNFNTLLMAVMHEAVNIAETMAQRRSVAIAGPFPLVKAHQLAQLLNRAYAKGLTTVPLNKFMTAEQAEKKCKFRETEISANDIMPVTEERVIKHCGKPQPKSFFTRFTIAIAPRELKVTICEKNTAKEIEEELMRRGKVPHMDFAQSRKGDRGGGGLRQTPMPTPEQISGFKSFVQPTGASKQSVIQELIQLVRSLLQDQQTKQQSDQPPVLLKRKSTRRSTDNQMQSQELSEGGVQQAFITKINASLQEVAASASWTKDFSKEQKQSIIGQFSIIGGWQPCLATGLLVQIDSDTSADNKAIVIDDNSGKGKLSVIQLSAADVKVSKIDAERLKPIYSSQLDLQGAFGRNIDAASLFKAIMSLPKQVASPVEGSENQTARDSLFSPEFLLQKLLKVATKLPNVGGNQSQAMIDLIQVLIQISERGQDDCEQEGKPQTFWERDLAKQWGNLIDNAHEANTNFYLPREFYLSKEQADSDSDLKVLAELGMQALLKRASTSVQETKFVDVDYAQNKNYYLTGLSEQATDAKDNKQELEKSRKIKFYVDNVLPRAADVVSVDAYRSEHHRIQNVMLDVKGQMCMNWKMAIEQLTHTCKGSEIAFPDQHWDWSVHFFDEVSVDSWYQAKLKLGKRKTSGNDDDEGDGRQGAEDSKKLGIPLLDKLLDLGVEDILVQIKAIEYKRHCVLAEYTDVDSMTKHWLWIPIAALSKPSFQTEPAAISFLPQTLNKRFRETLKNTSIAYARQSLLKIVQALQADNTEALSMFKMPDPNLKLHDIISWAVWEKYGSSPVIGWMTDLRQIMVPSKISYGQENDSMKSQKQITTTGGEATTADMNEDQASAVIRKVFNECVDEFTCMQLSPDADHYVEDDPSQATNQDASNDLSDTLDQVKQAFDELVQKVESEGESAESSEVVKLFHALVDQCVLNWGALAEQVASEKAVVDICKEFEQLKQMVSENQTASGNALPLHELLPQKGKNAISTTLMFKRAGARMTPGSKLRFWAEPDQLNMLKEIHFMRGQMLDTEPIRIPEGKIWVSIHESVDLDILPDDEIVHEPRLEFVVFQAPKEWTVVFWLTEAITSSLMKDGSVKSISFAIKIFEKLMNAILTFYSKANAPGLLRSVTVRLIARLVIKIRYLYHQLDQSNALTPAMIEKPHLEKLFLTSGFITDVMEGAQSYIKLEDEDIMNQSKMRVLYPAIVQDAAELLMNISIPLQKTQAFTTSKELLSSGGSQIELPQWTSPLVNVSHFLHFFRGEARLSQKLLDEVFNKTRGKHFKHHLDNVVVIRKVPSAHVRYTRAWIIGRIIEILTMHQARIIDPQKDIHVMPDEDEPEQFHSIVIFLDDFSHLRANDNEMGDGGNDADDLDDMAPKIVQLYSETDDEKEDGDGNGDDEAKEEVVDRPTMYICTGAQCPCGGMENDIDNDECVYCCAERPPMEDLLAAHKAKRKAEKAEEKANAAANADSDDEEGEPLYHLRLKKLKRDIRHLISHDQRLIALQRLEESKKDKEEDASKNEGEEAKKEDAKEEEKKEEKPAADDSDASPDEDILDLDNLPEDFNERLRLLGVDESLIEEGGDWLADIEVGALAEKRTEVDRQKEEQVERRKRRKAKEDARKVAALKNSGQAEEKLKLEVSIMREETFDGDSKVKETLASALRARVQERSEEESKEFQLSEAAKTTIKKLHQMFQTFEIVKLSIPREIEDKLADFGIRKETLKSNSAEDVIAKMRTIVLTDSIAFFKLLVSQGFDLWLTQACYPVCDLKKMGIQISDLRNNDLLKRVRQLVETDFCKDRSLVSELDPALLRLIRQIPDRSEPRDFTGILNRGDTTDEEEATAAKQVEEEKKGEPDQEVQEEEKKELAEEEDKQAPEEEDKKAPEDDAEAKTKRKAAKQEKLKSVKESLMKMKLATIFDVWRQDAFNSKDIKAMTEEQKTQLQKVQAALNKPKQRKIFSAWKPWAQKHANDRKLTWEQTLQSTRPISCFNDISVKDNYAEVLEIFGQAQVRFAWAFIRVFNKYFSKALRFIKQTDTPVAVPEARGQLMTIGAYLSAAKDICLTKAKNDLKSVVLTRTAKAVADDSAEAQLPRIVFTRLKDASAQTGEEKEKLKAKPSFVQAFEQIKNMDVSGFRQPKPQGSLPHLGFRVVFKGEDVEGDGGPYRQVFQDWSSELQPAQNESSADAEILDLLKPCANQTGGEQVGKDRFVINTGSSSSVDLQKYFFLGVLMGICCRTGVIFSLDLPRMFWKQLTGQRVTLDDVVEVEWRFLRSMQQMLSYSQEVFEMMPQYWETTLADDRQFNLIQGGDGASQQVEYAERFDYLRKALMARLTETHVQLQAIRRGLCQVIPESMLNLSNMEDLETWICGSCKPDIALLRRHTEYPKDDPDYARDSRLIKDFWRFLDEISEEDRKKFIIFCWGQQRLPPTDAAYESVNLSFKIKRHSGKDRRGSDVNMDDQLPQASTCFFHFTLPLYTSYESLMKKILIAVHTDCIGMNAEVQRAGEQEEE